MLTKKLTGRRRHRPVNIMFKPTILVLQVEENESGYNNDDNNGPCGNVDRNSWRDATVEDLTGEVAA